MPISHLHWPAVACQQAGTWHVPITPITGNFDEKLGWLCCNLLYPRSTEGGMGVYWIHPDVCQSVGPSVDKVSRTFCKKLLPQFISYQASTLMGWVSWPLYIFVFLASFLALWWLNIWPKMRFPELFEKLLDQFISYLAFTLMEWVSWPLYIFMFLASFSALWWPNIWAKMGFPELFEKTIGSIHFIPGIYPYRVSFLTPLHFRVLSPIFGPLVAKYLGENGVSGTFWKNYWLNLGESLWPLYIFMFLASFSALWWPNIWLKLGFPD